MDPVLMRRDSVSEAYSLSLKALALTRADTRAVRTTTGTTFITTTTTTRTA